MCGIYNLVYTTRAENKTTATKEMQKLQPLGLFIPELYKNSDDGMQQGILYPVMRLTILSSLKQF